MFLFFWLTFSEIILLNFLVSIPKVERIPINVINNINENVNEKNKPSHYLFFNTFFYKLVNISV